MDGFVEVEIATPEEAQVAAEVLERLLKQAVHRRQRTSRSRLKKTELVRAYIAALRGTPAKADLSVKEIVQHLRRTKALGRDNPSTHNSRIRKAVGDLAGYFAEYYEDQEDDTHRVGFRGLSVTLWKREGAAHAREAATAGLDPQQNLPLEIVAMLVKTYSVAELPVTLIEDLDWDAPKRPRSALDALKTRVAANTAQLGGTNPSFERLLLCRSSQSNERLQKRLVECTRAGEHVWVCVGANLDSGDRVVLGEQTVLAVNHGSTSFREVLPGLYDRVLVGREILRAKENAQSADLYFPGRETTLEKIFHACPP